MAKVLIISILDQATANMIQTSNNILQKQNEILEQNQRTLHNLVSKNKGT